MAFSGFYPGQKVVVVNKAADHPNPSNPHHGYTNGQPRPLPIIPRNTVLTVRGFRAPSSLYIEGIFGPKNTDGIEYAYCAYCFKPAVEQNENVSEAIKLFRELAANPNKKISA